MSEEKFNSGRIEAREITTEITESYLDYAMSVIVARALPDVRDGLKPVHRRILYSMEELGLRSSAKFRKSATVVGDVLGKYHPHGDMAVYDSLVRMAQPFAIRYPLINGQGNFGSMDGDSPAAMRYTEAKMKPIASEMLANIDEETVAFVDNYDSTRKEPSVLPASFPNLIVNGATGIAVGMATNIPPHNLGEVIDALIYLSENPEADITELMKFIKGPDFPTGANIYGQEEILAAYSTGKGGVIMRASAEIVEYKKSHQIIISEIPYQVNKADLITKIADLVKSKKLDGIFDIRDESDRKEGVRIVIDLKASAYPKKILNRLYELTPMQTAFHMNLLALVDGIQPKVLTLKSILEHYLAYRKKVVVARSEFRLRQAKERMHILEGLLKALENINEVIDTIKKSENRTRARVNLMSKYKFSEKQAEAILEMRLSALAALESQQIKNEYNEKLKEIGQLEEILANENKVLEIIKKELIIIKEKYADKRRTKVYKEGLGTFRVEDLIPNEQVVVALTTDNYIKRMPLTTFRSQLRGGKGTVGITTKEEDTVAKLMTVWTHSKLLFFTDLGKVFAANVYDLPIGSRQAKGQALVNFLQLAPDEKITAVLDASPKNDKYLVMATVRGVVKKTEISKYENMRKSGLIAIKLNSGDFLRFVELSKGGEELILVSERGQSIRFSENNIRPMGRSAAGVRGIKLRANDQVISMEKIPTQDSALMVVSENGFGKKSNFKKFTLQKRGGIGILAARVTNKTGKLVASQIITESVQDAIFISESGKTIRIPIRGIKELSRDTQGVTLMKLNKGDRIVSSTIVHKKSAEEEANIVGGLEPEKELENQVEEKVIKKEIKEKNKEEEMPDKVEPVKKQESKEISKPSNPKMDDSKKYYVDDEPNYWGKQ